MTATDQKIGIYIHIPFCKAKCNYCAFVSTPDFSLQKQYVSALIGEIKDSKSNRPCVDSVYIGGGTPSCLYSGGLYQIMNALHDSYDIVNNSEITVECNPESVTADFIAECLDIGVNRISMGLQSSCDASLRAIGRIHTFSDYLKAVKLVARSFDNISSDIILGLPNQTSEDVLKSVTALTEYCCHASVYALTVEDGTPLCKTGYVPSDDVTADLYDLAYAKLIDCGFGRYEVSNFAVRGRESRHNLKYWSCVPYVGFGVAAHGYDGAKTRYFHGDDILEYIESPKPQSYSLSDKDLYNEYVMLRLRTESGIAKKLFFKRFGYDFYESNKLTIERLEKEGLIVCDGDDVKIASDKMFVMNSIIEQLMLD